MARTTRLHSLHCFTQEDFMRQTPLRPAYLLSLMIAALTIVASAGGLFIDGLYQDETLFVITAWFANDVITLVVAAPLLVGALLFLVRGSQRAQLVWLGMLDFTLYNFAFYLFGAAFNSFFLIYTLLFILSIFALIYGLVYLDVEAIHRRFRARTPVKWLSGYMALWAAILGIAWIAQSLAFVFTGQVPQVGGSVEVFRLIAILDLSLVVSFVALGALWLWSRRPWGYVLAVIVNVKGAVYTLVLIAGSFVGANAGIDGAMDLVGLWIFFAVGCLISCVLLLGNMQATTEQAKSERVALWA
jgi:hypothetical protein